MVSSNPLLSDRWQSWALLLLFAPGTRCRQIFSERPPMDRSRREKHKRRSKIAPRPLPPRRKRALSAPLERPEEVGLLRLRTQATHAQPACALLGKLPLEIRMLIWSHVLGGWKIRITKRYRRLGHARCRHVGKQCSDGCVGYYDANWYKEAPSLTGCLDDMSGFGKEDLESEEGGLLSLLLTCRLIYSEGINMLYSENDFAVRNLDCITYLSTTLLPQRFNRIRTLQVNWCVLGWQNSILSPRATPPYDWASWESIWKTVAGMKELKILRIGLTTRLRGSFTPKEECRLFQPFREMKHVERIEITTAYPVPKSDEWQTVADERLIIKRVDPDILDESSWTFES